MIRALIACLVVGSCGVLQAAPLLYFTLEGRRQGSMDAFASNVEVLLGDTIEYRLLMRMAPLDTYNERIRSASAPYKHGVNSLSVSILQQPSDPIQIDFSSRSELAAESQPSAGDGWGWSWAPGHGWAAKSGTLAPRTGSTLNDLVGIRPLHSPGVFTGGVGVEETVLSGAFTVAALGGDWGQVQPEWGSISGGGRFDGRDFYVTTTSEFSSDPVAQFTGLTLTAGNLAAVPEPSTIALIGTALFGLAFFRRRTRRAPVNGRSSVNALR